MSETDDHILLPRGYPAVPADYSGEVFLESQMRAYGAAVRRSMDAEMQALRAKLERAEQEFWRVQIEKEAAMNGRAAALRALARRDEIDVYNESHVSRAQELLRTAAEQIASAARALDEFGQHVPDGDADA